MCDHAQYRSLKNKMMLIDMIILFLFKQVGQTLCYLKWKLSVIMKREKISSKSCILFIYSYRIDEKFSPKMKCIFLYLLRDLK
jgi:hypothetical protein